MSIVLIGLGSELMGDDAAGLKVVDILEKRVSGRGVDFKKCHSTGFEIMENLEGYESAIIVDTIVTGLYKPGEIVEIEPDVIKYSTRISSFHDFDLYSSIELGRRMKLKMPERIMIYGIEIRENYNFSEDISEEVRISISKMVDIVLNELENIMNCKLKVIRSEGQ